MTNHLTDSQLNEILDGRAESPHLATCPDCRARLDDLHVVFAALESLPEQRLSRDLTASILARLQQRRVSPVWRWAFIAQSLGALGLLSLLLYNVELPAEILNYQPPTLDSLLASFFAFISSLSFELPTFDLQPFGGAQGMLSTFNFQSDTVTLLAISAALLWLIGNSLLLRTPARRSR